MNLAGSPIITHAARIRAACVIALLALAACADGTDEPGTDASSPARAGTPAGPVSEARPATPGVSARIVDSILPVEEELRRFQAGLPVPTGLQGGAPSREAIVRTFVARLAARDTAGLLALTLTRAEFAHLLYPGSSYTRPPYRTAPGLVWMQLEQDTRVGIRRLLRADLREPAYVAHQCSEPPVTDGGARLWRGCTVRLRLAGAERLEGRLFGVIVEHRGRFKFASLQTDF